MKIFRVWFDDKRIFVKIDLVVFSNVFHERSSELIDGLVNRVKEIFERYGLENVDVSDDGYSIVFSTPISPILIGYIERDIFELERSIMDRFGLVEHKVSIHHSLNKIPIFRICVYKVFQKISRGPEGYRITGRICNFLSKSYHVYWGELGLGIIATMIHGGLSYPDEIRIEVEGKPYSLKCVEIRDVDLNSRRDRFFLQRFIDRIIRDRLREKGYRAWRNTIFMDKVIYDHEQFDVRMNVNFQTIIYSDGFIGLSLSPRHSIRAKKSLWEVYGLRLIENRREVRGIRVRSKHDMRMYFVKDVLDKSIDEPLDELKGFSMRDIYGEYGLDSGEPGVLVYREGLYTCIPPSLLYRIYDLHELKKLGVSRDVYRCIRRNLHEWPKIAEKIVGEINPISLLDNEIYFKLSV